MKKAAVTDKIIRFGKTHWQICAVSLFFILTGMVCSKEIYVMLEETQRQQLAEMTILLNIKMPFLRMLIRKIVFWGVQCLFSAYILCLPGYLGMDLFCMIRRSICWQMVCRQQGLGSGLLCLILMMLCVIWEYLKNIYALRYIAGYYKKQYRELHIPKSAPEIRKDSLQHFIKMFSLFLAMLPIWSLEIGAWLFLWE